MLVPFCCLQVKDTPEFVSVQAKCQVLGVGHIHTEVYHKNGEQAVGEWHGHRSNPSAANLHSSQVPGNAICCFAMCASTMNEHPDGGDGGDGYGGYVNAWQML
jgi:hypothetical protein